MGIIDKHNLLSDLPSRQYVSLAGLFSTITIR